jgi:hypothetical protein
MSDFACPRKGHASHSSNTAPGYEVGKTTKKRAGDITKLFPTPYLKNPGDIILQLRTIPA